MASVSPCTTQIGTVTAVELGRAALLRPAGRVQREGQREHAVRLLVGRGPAGDPGAGAAAAEHQRAGEHAVGAQPARGRPSRPRRAAAAPARSACRPPATAARPAPPASRRRPPPTSPRPGRRTRCRRRRRARARGCPASPPSRDVRAGGAERGVDLDAHAAGSASSASTTPARSGAVTCGRLVDRRVGALAAREPGAGEPGPLRAEHVPAVRGDQRHALRGDAAACRPPRGTPRGPASRPGSTSLDSDRSTSGAMPPRSSPASATPGEPWLRVTTRNAALDQPAQRRLDVRVRGQLAEAVGDGGARSGAEVAHLGQGGVEGVAEPAPRADRRGRRTRSAGCGRRRSAAASPAGRPRSARRAPARGRAASR